MVTRFFVLALVAIVVALVVPAVSGAAVPRRGRDHAFDGEVDMVGHGVLGDLESGHFWKVKLMLVKEEADPADTREEIRRFGPPPPTGFPASRG